MYPEIKGHQPPFGVTTMKDSNQFSTSPGGPTTSMRVVRAVATELGVDPVDLPPLYEEVDPEALDSLFQTAEPADPNNRIQLQYGGCEVAVSGTGQIEVNGSTVRIAQRARVIDDH